MKNRSPESVPSRRAVAWALAACAAAVLSACGGGGSGSGSSAAASGGTQASAEIATGTTILQMDVASLPDAAAELVATPLFHAAPVLLAEPDDADRVNHDASALRAPRQQWLPSGLSALSTRRVTVQDIEANHRAWAASAPVSSNGEAAPMATGSVIATYTPAQIRAAYGLPALPAAGTTLTKTQAAQLGAGQTIYIVDAKHDPNAVAELAAFNQKFGLPTCTTKAIAATATLPLAAASASSCEFSVVYSTTSGGMTATAPAYDSGWATEIALDVQWAHATAPLARIVLIEAPDASVNSLTAAVRLANAMGPGIVSMSFGALEGSWTSSVESTFTGTNMTYLAATGDSGAAVAWPSVSPKVLAVGGTTLTYSGTGARSEVAWSGTGGGISQYTATPSYQTSTVPGMGTLVRRAVADVAFNADPASGQYTAVMPQGSTSVNWLSVGGTSLSTPQWAGVVAVANALRVAAAKPVLGTAHPVLYGQIASVAGSYASAFSDITLGSDGSCTLCTAKLGYDPLTGLGTPNVGSLLNALAGSTSATPAPVVTSATISGTAGKALSFTVSVTATNPVSYTLSGAPTGMSISASGVVSWASPVAGTYAVTVKALDATTGQSGQGTYTVVIAQVPAPVVGSAAITGKVGTPLSFAATVTSTNPVTYSLVGAPAGMAISTTGTVIWTSPVAGTYSVTVVAKDTKTGLSGQGVYTVAISAPQPPVVGTAAISGKPGVALSFQVSVTSADPVTYTLSGAPAGMTIGSTGVVTWTSPVLGTYAVTVTAKNTKTGLSGKGVYTVTIATDGPVITASTMTGVAGKAMTGTLSISAPGATSLSISISGVPLGMSFSMNGLTLTAAWASPVVGSYTMQVVVVDQAGRTAKASIPIKVTAS